MTPRADLPISDEFTVPTGEFVNYDAIPDEQRAQMLKQKHVNLRSFVGDTTTYEDISIQVTMLFLDALSMESLSGKKMNILSSDNEARVVVRQGERWTAGVATRDTARNNWYSLTLSCDSTANPTVTSSIMLG